MVKVGIVLLFLGFGGLCSFWYTQVGLGFDLIDLTPDDSYVRDFFVSVEQKTGRITGRVDAYLVYSHVEFHTAETQNAMNAFNARVRAAPEMYAVVEWMPTFYAYTNRTQPQFMQSGVFVPGSAAAFGAAMRAFLNYTCPSAAAGCVPGTRPNTFFSHQVSFQPGSDIVRALRLGVTHRRFANSIKEGDCVLAMQALTESAAGFKTQPFLYTQPYIYWHQYTIIVSQLYLTLVLVVLSVCALCLFILGSLGNTAVVMLSLVLVDIDLLGILQVWKLNVNSITVINLVMAIGLVVDYGLHLVHCCGSQDASMGVDERITKALAEIGPAVMMGATTTFIGIVPLSASKSEVFRVFFRMMLGVVVFGFLHGLVFTPVVLSLLGSAVEAVFPPPGRTASTKETDIELQSTNEPAGGGAPDSENPTTANTTKVGVQSMEAPPYIQRRPSN